MLSHKDFCSHNTLHTSVYNSFETTQMSFTTKMVKAMKQNGLVHTTAGMGLLRTTRVDESQSQEIAHHMVPCYGDILEMTKLETRRKDS